MNYFLSLNITMNYFVTLKKKRISSPTFSKLMLFIADFMAIVKWLVA